MRELGRWAARLQTLPHAELVELAAAGCASSAIMARTADAKLAEIDPLPAWAVNDVLLNADLVSHIFAAIALADVCPLGRVCSAWNTLWGQKVRARTLRMLSSVSPRFLPDPAFSMKATGDRLYIEQDTAVAVLDRDMNLVRTIEGSDRVLGATHNRVYTRRIRDDHDEFDTVVVHLVAPNSLAPLTEMGLDDDHQVYAGALATDCLVVSLGPDSDEGGAARIVRLDLDSLEELSSWPLQMGLTLALAVHNREIYVGLGQGGIAVFTYDGSLLRTINLPSPCNSVRGILFQFDRFYVTTAHRHGEHGNQLPRLLALHSSGGVIENLNVETSTKLFALASFGRKLIVTDPFERKFVVFGFF
jgi:hypothetical protein